MLAYFMSRAGTLAFSIALLALHIASISNCAGFALFEGILAILATSSSSFLFFARVRAVYENSRPVTAFFASFWLAIVGTGFLFLFAVQTSNPTGTKRCAMTGAKPWAMSLLWVKAAFDTCVLIAVSLRLASQSSSSYPGKPPLWTLLRGGVKLPRLCRELVNSGQLFYLSATIGVTLLGACVALTQINIVFRYAFTGPAIAIESSMACRVFRTVALQSATFVEDSDFSDTLAMTTFIYHD
ncbi:hypothetical protein FIBSPDRAFT_868440 [Athelia psychrophila]|uniref:G-protein coupled receptors family 3 profile domain-containing protein n=1 Tax=Athelia psychrophila TaxID=1759441 RepID=A0A167UFC3_9AGAM|nr:hypothetical protein FIBSPDRAFT_879037 [Fibularhizoctonia sp. CBS 109695]KZP14344.1 hypothetical protein FIBSPDRAFT_868440 [Fibularhizoctonia sp. CBS 109695]